MSSFKRRKTDENVPSGLLREKKHKKAKTAKDVATEPAKASASPDPEPAPTATETPEEVIADGGHDAEKESSKSFKDLVGANTYGIGTLAYAK